MDKKNVRRLILSSVLGFGFTALCGCASMAHHTSPSDLVDDSNSGPLSELRATAVEAKDELRLLAKTRDAVTAPILNPAQINQMNQQAQATPAGFNVVSSFHFKGEAEKAGQALSMMAGYSFEVAGNRSRVPVIVQIDEEHKPLAEALRDLGAQTGDSVMVEVYADTKKLRFVYKDRF